MRLALAAMALAACAEPPLFGPLTEAPCPEVSVLTYESFGKPFMETYCVACHDSAKRGADRRGAPSFHDFDTLFGVKAVHEHIDQTTAFGPAALNESMPPSDWPQPTLRERRDLGEWIACGMP